MKGLSWLCGFLTATFTALTPSSVEAQQYGLTSRPTVGAYFDGKFPAQPPAIGADWSVVDAFPGLTFLNPVGITQMPGQEKMVVWEREGRVYWFDRNAPTTTKTLILDVSNQCQGWDDSGLLGLAFHPNFSLSGAAGTNRHVFIWYTYCEPGTVLGNANSRPTTNRAVRDRLSRFTLDASGVAVPGSETVFLDQNGNSVWHNGGGMFFHPDNGFLYITNGDDGNGNNSQQITGGLFAGIIRIDVDLRGGSISHAPPRTPTNATTANYFIPNDNPFVGRPNAVEEFYATGLRSPHRMTIDPITKRIFIGDVGAGAREEISVIEPNDPAGANFQWPTIEGLGGDLNPPYIGVNKRPIIDYGHNDGAAVIGGYVYRGTAFSAELGGRYIFGDNINGNIWVLDESTTPASKILLTALPPGPGPNAGNNYVGLSSFGIDSAGELYMCQLSSTQGRIYKLQRGGTPSQPLPTKLSDIGFFSDLAALTPSAKLIPYGLIQPFWSDGAVKSRWAVVPSASQVSFAATGEWTWPEGSVFVKHFDLPVSDVQPSLRKRLETRVLVKMASGATYGATYKWRADHSDADLLDSAITENVPIAISPIGALQSADIGAPAIAGSTSRVGDVLTMQAGGADIWGTADQFQFAYQQRTGDFDISVRLESVSQADLYTKAGLMARESLDAGSRHVYAMAFPSNASRNNNIGGYEFQYRTTTGGGSTAIYPATPQPQVNYPNTWLRLRREGDVFIGYSSADGVWWDEFARYTINLPSTVYFGFALCSHNAGTSTTAKVHLQSTRQQPWYYPSRTDCTSCHNQVAGGVLGPKTRQLNGNYLYPSGVSDNQLRTLAHIGFFQNPPPEGTLPNLDRLAAQGDQSASLEKRARSYLDANCSYCHMPGGVQAFWDGRFDTPLAQQGLLYGTLANHLGDPSARVIVPQSTSRSVLYRRMSTVGTIQMPPLAKNMVDPEGAALLAEWIQSMAPNTPPTVAVTSPANNASFLQSDQITLTATAADADGIQKVEFYDGVTKLGEDATAPYEYLWTGATRGIHPITATAVDAIGNSAQSAVVNIRIEGAPLPSPWEHDDVGNVGIAGDASYANGAFTVSASGDDIWNTADAFHFVSRPLEGDGEITARVVSLANTNPWAKAGVMIRESLAAGSRFAFSAMTVDNGAAFQRRVTTNGSAEHTGGPAVDAPYWVRLTRAGNVFTASVSPNGTTWTVVGTQTITMAADVLVGLALTSHDNGEINEAVMDNVSVSGAEPTYLTKINFQTQGAAVPEGYLADTGAPFGPRGNGLEYGWSRDNTADARDRDSGNAPDQRYDTLIHMQKAHGDGSNTSSWELQVPNGEYQVRVVAGDPANSGDAPHITAEGITLINGTTSAGTLFLEGTAMVTVQDGRLTIALGTGANNTKICFAEITSYDVGANQAPIVSITQPTDGAVIYTAANSVTISATASDVDGTVAKVEFFVDGVKISEDTTAPYQAVWTPTYGPHELTAQATDIQNGTGVSAPVGVEIYDTLAQGFRGEYYSDQTLTTQVLVRLDSSINFNWGNGSPDPAIAANNFSVRWSGRIRPRYTERYSLITESDDGVRLWVNGVKVIDQWIDQGPTRYVAQLDLVADQNYDIVMEYYENGGGAVARLSWSSASQAEEIIPSSRVLVPLPPNAAPIATLTGPVSSTQFLPEDVITLTAEASDVDGNLEAVEFWADGVKLGEDLTSPYTWSWGGAKTIGTHAVNAVARDTDGATGVSSAVTIEVLPLQLHAGEIEFLSNPARIVFHMNTTLPSGRNYTVWWSSNLTQWNVLRSGVSDGSPIEISDTTQGVPYRFYRVSSN